MKILSAFTACESAHGNGAAQHMSGVVGSADNHTNQSHQDGARGGWNLRG